MLPQEELDKILNDVRKDNTENEPAPVGVALPQSALDDILGEDASSTVVKPQPEEAKTYATPEEAEAARAAKIAARKARTAELLARVNANSPKRISVIYGSALLKGSELSALKPEDTLTLDRGEETAADILVDGKQFGRGIITYADGKASVKITEIFANQ